MHDLFAFMFIMILTQYSFEIYHANDGKSMRTNLVMLPGNVTHRQQCVCAESIK